MTGARPRRFSTRAYLLAFGMALTLPGAAFVAAAFFYYASHERTRLENEAVELSRQISLTIDTEIEKMLALLTGLSSSPLLSAEDLTSLHAQARRAIAGTDDVIVLRTLDGKQLLNTQVPYGTPLPPAVALSEEDRQAFAANRPRVSDVYASPISGEARVAVSLRPPSIETPDLLMALTVPTKRINEALEAVPNGWLIGVADRKGTYITHSTRHDEVSGKPGFGGYLAGAVGKSGSYYAANAAGRVLLAGYHRSDLSGWLTAANIPADLIEAPLRRSLLIVASAAFVVLGISIAFALLFSGRLARDAQALAARAEALGEGDDPLALRTSILEMSIIDGALAHASQAIRDRAQLTRNLFESVQQKDMLLKEVNHRVKNSLQLVASLLNLQRSQIQDPAVRRQFEEAAGRINTVALIHQRLYADDRPDRVALDQFLIALCRDFDQMLPERNIRIVCDAAPCHLSTDRVIPAAIIINELITNAFKHSFPEGRTGTIHIACREQDGEILLSVSDSGAALPADFDMASGSGPGGSGPGGSGLGSKIMKALTKQLRGSFAWKNTEDGKTFTLTIPADDEH